MPYKVSIIIPCLWSSSDLYDMTVKCVRGLLNVEAQVVVIGADASYASNVNAGLRAADGDVLVVCNNDVEFIDPHWLDHLLSPLLSGTSGINSIRTTDADGWETEDRLENNAKFGSLWAMTRQTYETLGPLEESFGRGYFEDLDYWHRAQDAGIKITKNHNGLVEHIGRATFDTIDSAKIYNRAMLKYKQKWPQSILFTQQQNGATAIVLADEYDLVNYPATAVQQMQANAITVSEARRLWGFDAD